jgi:hypothetical protein
MRGDGGQRLTAVRPGRTVSRVAGQAHVAPQEIESAVEVALGNLLPAGAGGATHLARAVMAERIAAAAAHLSKNEVTAARESDGASWDDVAHAFGISAHDAHERFRTRGLGLPL